MLLYRVTVAGVALGLLASSPGYAADPSSRSQSGLGFTVGLGVAMTPDYEGSNDYRVWPAGFLRFSNLYHPATYVQIAGPGLESNLIPDDHWRMGFVASFSTSYRHVDDRAVKRLRRPESGLQAGVVIGYDFSDRRDAERVLEVRATYDVLHGNGFLITPRAHASVPLTPDLSLGGGVSVTWASSDYMSNRFSVSGSDSLRSGLRPYKAGSGFKDVGLDVSLTYAFSQRWALTGFANYQLLLGDAAKSPIVKDRGNRNNFTTGMIVSYSF